MLLDTVRVTTADNREHAYPVIVLHGGAVQLDGAMAGDAEQLRAIQATIAACMYKYVVGVDDTLEMWSGDLLVVEAVTLSENAEGVGFVLHCGDETRAYPADLFDNY